MGGHGMSTGEKADSQGGAGFRKEQIGLAKWIEALEVFKYACLSDLLISPWPLVFRIETVGIGKVAKWVFELRTEFATSFKFRNVFARQNWSAKFSQPLRNFHKVHLGFVKFSQGEFGVVKFSQALANCSIFPPSEKIWKDFPSVLESTCNLSSKIKLNHNKIKLNQEITIKTSSKLMKL